MPAAHPARTLATRLFLLALGALMLVVNAPSAAAQATDRVIAPVNPRELVALGGHHPAWASSQTDVGAVPGDLRLQHLTLLLARPPQVQQALDQFLQNQQDPASPDYHHWLTSFEFGQRFGVSQHDIAAINQWLQSQNLQVDSVSDSRVRINFSGSASAVASAFGAEMHYFTVSGEKRISITAEPQIPAALAPVIQSIHGLYTLINRPMHRISEQPGRLVMSPSGKLAPEFNLSNGSHAIVPGDFAVIYDVNAAYTAGVFGFGQTIGIIGRSRVNNADIENFQALTLLPIQDPVTIIPPGGLDPGPAQTAPPALGISPSGDQGEATLDVTRSGSIALGATVALVVSASSATTDGIDLAMQYAVDANPVPAHIMSISFGSCEAHAGAAVVHFYDSLFSQGAAEGISIFVSSGDSAAAGCDLAFQPPPASGQIQSPNVICSSSYATCVGGTEFADFTNPSLYWSGSNGSDGTSALSYIPEGAWNEPQNSSAAFQVAGTGGGVSTIIPTPPWQTGTGVPAGRTGRYTPDVAFSASGHDGYFACLANSGADCSTGAFTIFSGTSAAAPDMAGITALLAQRVGTLGNLNPTLYRLAATPANGVFHDVTVATSGVSGCSINIPSMCNNSTPSPTGLMGGLAGFLVGTGYDEATGLGSIDVNKLLSGWGSVSALGATSTTLSASANPALASTAVKFTATVTPTTGPTPTGSVNFLDSGILLGSGALSAGVATFTTTAGSLAAGAHTITAVYGGDGSNTGSISAPLTETITTSYPGPILLSLSPSSANAGGGSFVLTVQGSNFFPASTVQWNGSSSGLVPTYVNGTELQVTIPLADIASPGVATVTVTNPAPGGVSSPLTFSVLEAFSGTGGFLSMFVNGTNLGNSALFQSGGLIGVGTTSPIRTLDVNGEIQARGGNLFLQRNLTDLAGRRNWAWGTETFNVGDMSFFVSTSNSNFPSVSVLTLLSNGSAGIGGVPTPATALQVKGDIRVGTSGTNGCLQNFAGTALTGTCSSDARLKTNILPFAPILDKLVKLQPVHFDWNTEQYPDYHFGAGRSSGLLAQDVETVFPEMVSADAHGFKMVNYSELPYLTLAAIRELKTENDALRSQLAERQRELENLRQQVVAVEARLARLEKPQSRTVKKKKAVQPKPAAGAKAQH